jgi:CheY-like chemotaxis protein
VRKSWFQGKSVLVVDDNEWTRYWLCEELKILGIQSTAIPSAAEALHWLAEGNGCDLLMIDFSMPEIDGLTFAHQIAPHYPELPILLMASYGERIADEILVGTISKPLKQKQLHSQLSTLLYTEDLEAPGFRTHTVTSDETADDVQPARDPQQG